MNIAKFSRTPFYRTPPVATSVYYKIYIFSPYKHVSAKSLDKLKKKKFAHLYYGFLKNSEKKNSGDTLITWYYIAVNDMYE